MSDQTPVPVMVAPFHLDPSATGSPPGPTPPEPRSRRDRHRGSRSGDSARRRPRRRGRVVAALVVVVLAAGATFVEVRLNAPLPAAAITAAMRPTWTVAHAPVSLPWPATGEAAVAVPSIGMETESAAEQPVPVASLTKMMTAYVVLHDHPLAAGQDGPDIVITQADLNDFDMDTVSDQANAQVALGEELTERQLLGGMLVHSANDYADALATWDAGSVPAFVVKMNTAAASLGMTQSHFADPSGFSTQSQSTADDLLKVAGADIANPVVASLVKMTSITLPVAGTISTYTPLLGVQGVIGVKSGFTTAAGGCDVLAVVRSVHGLPVLVLSAVTGQQGLNVLDVAGLQALNLANATANAIGSTPVVHPGQVVARVTAAGHTVDAAVASTGQLLTWPGVSASRVLVTTRTVIPGTKAGTRIGSVILGLGTQRVVVPVRLTADLPRESISQRLF